MEENLNDIDRFKENISWLEKENPEIIIYSCRRASKDIPILNHIKISPLIRKISQTELIFEDKYSIISIDVFGVLVDKDINTFKTYEDLIKKIFSFILEQGSLFTWCMFEGGFVNISNLFSKWEVNSTYAFQLHGREAKFAFKEDERNSLFWERSLRDLSEYLLNMF